MTTQVILNDGQTIAGIQRAANALVYVSDERAAELIGRGAARYPMPDWMLNDRMIIVGDSYASAGGYSIHTAEALLRPWYTGCVLTTTNLGNGLWVVWALQGANSTTSGDVATDGAGRLRYQHNGEGYGPWVDVRAGGFYVLQNGGATDAQCLVAVRGGTTPPSSPGSGALTRAGLLTTIFSESYGFPVFLSSSLRFGAREVWAMSGAKSADVEGFIRQAIAQPGRISCAVMCCGTNDNPSTSAEAAASIARMRTNIDLLSAACGRVYVLGIFPNTSISATIRSFHQRVNAATLAYCLTKPNVRYVSTIEELTDPDAVPVTLRAGTHWTDNLHLRPYGGYRAVRRLDALIAADFPRGDELPGNMDGVWDSVVGHGQWNANAALRGAAGTVTGSRGVTGTAPDGWTIDRNSLGVGPHLLTTSFTAADDGRHSWFTMAYSAGDGSDYHTLRQVVTVPAGISAGDAFVIECEMCIFAQSGNGTSVLQVMTSAGQIVYAMAQFTATRGFATFNNEKPVLKLRSVPTILLAGVTTITLEIRVGGAASASGSVGVRQFSIRKWPTQ